MGTGNSENLLARQSRPEPAVPHKVKDARKGTGASGKFDFDFYHANVRHDAMPLIPAECGRVLDVGGGVGATGSYLKAQGRATNVIVADLVDGMPAPGVERIVTGDLNDAEVLRGLSKHGPFDTIFCLDLLEHLYDPWAAISELQEMLAPDGCIVASIPNVNYVGLLAPLVLKGRFDYQETGILDRTHIRWFTKDSAFALMSRGRLRVEECFARVPDGKVKTLDRLTCGAFKRFFALQHVIRARRH